METNLREKAQELAEQPYEFRITRDETTDGRSAFSARVREIPGCVGGGLTDMEALQDARLALVDFIESLLEDGLDVPAPLATLPISQTTAQKTRLLNRRLSGDSAPAPKQETVKPAYLKIVDAPAIG
jgi:predicted RNase H-like HicB family nuclease